MMSIRRIISYLILAALLSNFILLCSCNIDSEIKVPEGSGYTIYKEDGQYYISVDGDDYDPDNSPSNDSIFQKYEPNLLKFDSLAQMKDTVLNGKLDSSMLEQLRREFYRDGQGRMPIIDFNQLYYPNPNANLTVRSISWRGISYNLYGNYGNMEDDVHFYCGIMSKAEYEETLRELYTDYFADIEHTKEENESTGEQTYFYESGNSKYKCIRYKLARKNGNAYVDEIYITEKNEDGSAFSDTPKEIKMYGEDGGVYFSASLNNIIEHPGREWLSEFGLKEFEGNLGYNAMRVFVGIIIVAAIFIVIAAVFTFRHRKRITTTPTEAEE